MKHNISLKKLGFRTAFRNVRDFYNLMDANREHLSPWFWWIGRDVTPNLQKKIAFMTLYILDTKRKKLMNRLNRNTLYDEKFFIMVDDKVGGMTGLDNIDNKNKDAEIWYLLTSEHERRGIASRAVQILENYSISEKNLSSLYAKVADGNVKSANLMNRNNYSIKTIEYQVPVSKRNPKITDLTTWIKYLNFQRS